MLKFSAWNLNFNMIEQLHQNHVKLLWVIMWLPNQEYICSALGQLFKGQSWWKKKIMLVGDIMIYCPFGGFPYYVSRSLNWGFMSIYIWFTAFMPRIKDIRSVQTQILCKFDEDEQLNEVKLSIASYWQLGYHFSLAKRWMNKQLTNLSQVKETSEQQADLVSTEAKEEVAPAEIKVYFVEIFWNNPLFGIRVPFHVMFLLDAEFRDREDVWY